MAREIDVSDPSKLTADDLRYLRDRGKLTREIIDGADPDVVEEADPLNAVNATVGLTDLENTGDTGTDADDGSGEIEDDEDNYDDEEEWSYKELQDEAKKRELPAGGSREDLVARLREDDAKGEGL